MSNRPKAETPLIQSLAATKQANYSLCNINEETIFCGITHFTSWRWSGSARAPGCKRTLMTREALRSRQSDAFGAGGIAGDRPTKCGVDRPGLKHALGVIYLSAAPSHNQRRRSALPSLPWLLIVHAASPRQGLAKQFTNAPSQKGTQHEASLPPRFHDQPNC